MANTTGHDGHEGSAAEAGPAPEPHDDEQRPGRGQPVVLEESKADALARAIRRRILTEPLAPGTRLGSEGDLGEASGASRPAVREALRSLASQGFVEIRRGRYGGVFVTYPQTQDLGVWLAQQAALRSVSARSLLEFRHVLEVASVRLAAERLTALEMAELQQLARSERPSDVNRFHHVLADCSGNALLSLVLEGVHHSLADYGAYDVLDETDLVGTRQAHQRIVDHLAAGRADEAAEAMAKHLRATEVALRRAGRLDDPIIPSSSW